PLEGRGSGRARPGGPRPAAWSARRSLLAQGLRALDPDLVAFQEAIRHDDYDQVTDVLGPGYEVAHQSGREADGSGVSIASRWPLGEVHEVDLQVTPRTADFPCTALVAEVQAPPPIGPLLFVNHKPNFELALEHERGLQALATASHLERLAAGRDVHVVVAGDFDATPDAASMRFWRGRQSLGHTSVCYRDAWEHTHPDDPGHTFTPANPMVADGTWPLERGRRIDYILVRCADHGPSLDITTCARIFDQASEGVWGSDHFGVVADLAVAPPEPMVPD
ncbi:MAG TPA: endonuclease/exonuclease/phosphatase family protein, partial [Actinomycetota bacterium]|nr:endonuclease/exonuclease/phosphatase family protein [Actinomycetota bacterium]